MMTAALVGAFGIMGALLRFGVDSWFAQHSSTRSVPAGPGKQKLHWPWATLVVNVAGCFLIGVSQGVVDGLSLGPEWHTGLAAGLAGGLTTFSSWTTATVRLISESRFGAAVLNIAVNLVLGLAAAALGIALTS